MATKELPIMPSSTCFPFSLKAEARTPRGCQMHPTACTVSSACTFATRRLWRAQTFTTRLAAPCSTDRTGNPKRAGCARFTRVRMKVPM